MADTDNVQTASKALEHITNHDHLEEIAPKASLREIRINALRSLSIQDSQYDLSQYRDLIRKYILDISDTELVSAVRFCNSYSVLNTCALVSAINLCEELSPLETVFERVQRLKVIDSEARRQTYVIPILQDISNTIARKMIPSTTDVKFLEHLRTYPLFSVETHEQAKDRMRCILLPDNASQQECFNIAFSFPVFQNEALNRLTDENLLYEAVIRGNSSELIEKIRDPELLGRIASDHKLSFKTRALAAKAGDIWNPFGNITLICCKCGKAAVYESDYETIDSYKAIDSVSCESCKVFANPNHPDKMTDTFIVGEDRNANLRDRIIFFCPNCRQFGGCLCTPKSSRIPVISSPGSISWDVKL